MIRRKFRALSALLIVGFVGSITSAALAQPLADRVPADSVIYVGWAGAEAMGPAYQQSHLRAVLDASDFNRLTQMAPGLMQQVTRQNASAAIMLQLVQSVAPILWNHPTALFVESVEVGPSGPAPHLGLIVSAGNDAQNLEAQLRMFVDHAPESAHVKLTNENGLIALTIGRTAEMDALLAANANAGKSLAGVDQFKAETGALVQNPAAVGYIDFDGLMKNVDALHQAMKPDDQQWAKVRQALGLGDLHRLYVTAGFEGKNWATHTLLVAEQKGTGITALLPAQPLSDDAYKLIPADAASASAGQLDMGRAFQTIHQIINDLDPRTAERFDKALQQTNEKLGLDVQKDLLASLGNTWVSYSSRDVAGNNLVGMVLVNHLADPAKAEKALSALEATINKQAGTEKNKVAFVVTDHDGLKVHTLEVPFVGPTWTIKDGNLYVALYPQVAVAAASGTASHGKTLLDNEQFVALRKQLNGQQAGGFSYSDLPRTAPDAYELDLIVFQSLTGAAHMNHVDMPAMLLPALHKILPELEPAARFSWKDQAGWHSRSICPFPGSTLLLSHGDLSPALAPVMVSVLLPSLSRARETANRAQSAANLRSVGTGLMLWANEHDGKYPASLGVVAMDEDLLVRAFVSSDTQVPPNVPNDRDHLADWVNQHTNIVYLGAGKNASQFTADQVLCYQKPTEEGTNVCYGDTHIEWVTPARLQELLNNPGK